jgi:hypothetical protein
MLVCWRSVKFLHSLVKLRVGGLRQIAAARGIFWLVWVQCCIGDCQVVTGSGPRSVTVSTAQTKRCLFRWSLLNSSAVLKMELGIFSEMLVDTRLCGVTSQAKGNSVVTAERALDFTWWGESRTAWSGTRTVHWRFLQFIQLICLVFIQLRS